ncbi:MAG: ABC transporter permease [Planctomycetes bacterium]|nr:ABC transporter permease [Planctomycetota bacterium]
MFIPLNYTVRSLFVRKAATFLSVFGIGVTVAIFAGVLALQQGFTTMFTSQGREDVIVFLRPGATGETDSQFQRERGMKLMKSLPEIEQTPEHGPLASMESYSGVLRRRPDGGEVNVAFRGVQQATFTIRGDELRIIEGRNFTPGADEIIVGKKLVERIQDCHVGDVMVINTTPFRVVGVFDHDGPFVSEIWADLERALAVLDAYGPNRVIAKVKPGTLIGDVNAEGGPDPASLAGRLANDTEAPAKVLTERAFLESQTQMLGGILLGLGMALAVIMGVGAAFTAINTMLSAIASRTNEIGILLATGFRPLPIFVAFMLETLLLCVMGGLVGCVLVLPINGIETGTMNGQTFTEVAFAFRVTPVVVGAAIFFSVLLGMIGGLWPALRACRMTPTAALRRT